MHIVAVTYFFPEQVGFGDFAQRLRSLSYIGDLTIVSRHSITHIAEFTEFRFREEILPSGTEGDSLLNLLAYLRGTARFIRRIEPDLLVCLGTQSSLLPLFLTRIRSLVYWNEHPLHLFETTRKFPQGLIRSVARWACFRGAKRATHTMPIGAILRDDLVEHGVPPEKCPVVSMGVDDRFLARPERRAARPPTDQTVKLFYAGSILPERGRDVMLEGVALARRRGLDVHLTLLGATPKQHEACLARIAELGIEGAVSVAGRVPYSEIPGWLADADAGLCLWEDRPYWWFNPPTKLFEYLVAGVPVLASRIRTHTEYICDGENGLIFDYTPEGLAEGIDRFIALGSKRTDLAAEAERDGREYLWSTVETRFLDLATADAEHPAARASAPPTTSGAPPMTHEESLFRLVREDLRCHREGLLSQGFWALLIYRLSNRRLRCRWRLLRAPWYVLNMILQKFVEMTCGICLPESTTVGRRLVIEHFGSIIVHGGTVFGDDVRLRQGVTIGNRSGTRPGEAPRFGNRVDIGAGAKILGPITIGDDAVIGANAVVITDVPAGALAVGVPAVVKPRRESRPLAATGDDAAPQFPVTGVPH